MPKKLVEVIRSGVVESVHKGDVVVVTSKGEILYSIGDIERLTFFRSSSKPLQAIAALETGIAEEFNLDLKEIGVMVSSHSAEKYHLEAVRSIIRKSGLQEDMLECGERKPGIRNSGPEGHVQDESPSKLFCNCSGKHAGLMAAARLKGYDVAGYSGNEHMLHQDIDRVLSDLCGVKIHEMIKGYDGCGIPVHAVPLKNMAIAYANLCSSEFMDGKYGKSQNYVLSAMTMYPEMVAGSGKLDTELMKKFGDRVIGKIGAEGVYCAGIPGKSVGLALKIEDGNSRAVGPAILETLLQMKVIGSDEIHQLKEFWNPVVFDSNGRPVGEIRAAFNLSSGL